MIPIILMIGGIIKLKKKEINKYFNFIKKINKDIFSYSEKKYIKDLIKNINMPKNKDNNLFYILHNYNSNNNDYYKIYYKK